VEELASNANDGQGIFIEAICCSANGTAALAEDGKVYTWGCGDHGQLGHNDTKDIWTPKPIQDLFGTDIAKIAGGDAHMFACTPRETYAWGWNGCGQLGIGHTEDQHRPHVVDTLRGNKVESIACGAAHSIAVVLLTRFDSLVVYSWGSNSSGQIGQGSKKKVVLPSPIAQMSKERILEVQCGSAHTLCRSENGEVWSAGLNKFGQLGHNNTVDLDEFKIVEPIKGKNCRGIAAGGQHSACLVARAWVEDNEAKECMACKSVFTFVNRKHHCRNCGGIFCNQCSSKRIAILKYGVTEPVRVCNACFAKLGGR